MQTNDIQKSLKIAQGHNVVMEGEEKDYGKGQGKLSSALNEIKDEIDESELFIQSRELDIELHNAVKNEVDGAILEETKQVMKAKGSKLTQALVTRLFDRANTIGRAYIMKKVLKDKKPLYDALAKLAKGGIYTEETVLYDKDGEVTGKIVKTKSIPPNISALRYLYTKIDGTLNIATATEVKETVSNIDDVVNNDN